MAPFACARKAMSLCLVGIGMVCLAVPAQASRPLCRYFLETSGDETGTAEARLSKNSLNITVRNSFPRSVYTVWIDHRNGASGELSADYPLSEGAVARGVAPAFATTAGVTEGIGRDANAFLTNRNGHANFLVKLDYNLLAEGQSPVVGAELSRQGENIVGGSWLRQYLDPENTASTQIVNRRGIPILPRSTPQGITIVRHDDPVTHGHSPGVGGVDHFPAFKGDFPESCK